MKRPKTTARGDRARQSKTPITSPEESLDFDARPVASSRSAMTWGAIGVLIIAGTVAYFNSFFGAFVYDDIAAIRDNRLIQRLWPLSDAMSLPLIDSGQTVSRRPLLSLTFALNHFVFGPMAWGFHLVNLVIHICAALLLFGLVRRTLCLEPFRKTYDSKSVPIALTVALIWLVHPLQTESVTYIAQRAESLMGMLLLLTLYCSLRGFQTDNSERKRGARWFVAAVLASSMGMGVKEVMFVAPILVCLYDGTFISASIVAALKNRKRFYAALAASWFVLFLVQYAGWQEASRDFTDRSPLAYALTQAGVILYYLRLSIWPSPLVMDYNWPTASTAVQILPALCAVVMLLGITARGVYQRRWYGFIGAWFFLILGPSSSFAALPQNLEEHRMYLSLAAVVLLVVLAGDDLLLRSRLSQHGRITGTTIVIFIAGLFAYQTYVRNTEYYSEFSLWSANVEDRPNSYVAHDSLGHALANMNRPVEAIIQYRRALEINPLHAAAHNNLGVEYVNQGRLDDAISHYKKALAIQPKAAQTLFNLADAYSRDQDPAEAISYYRQAIALEPEYAQAHYNLGNTLVGQGMLDDAISHYRQAIAIQPDHAKAHYNLGNTLFTQGKYADASYHFRRTIEITPNVAEAHNNLGSAMLFNGRPLESLRYFRDALEIDPKYIQAHFNLASAHSSLRQVDEAIFQYVQTIELAPQYLQAHLNLGALYLEKGEKNNAIKHFQQALQINPDSTAAKEALRRATSG